MKFTAKQTLGLCITGAAASAIVALLYAPKSGAQTRKDLRRFARRTTDRIEDLQEDIREQVGDWVEEVNDVFQTSMRSGKRFGVDTCQQVANVFDMAKKAVEQGKSRLEKM